MPPFDGSARVELHVPCTYDLEVAASRYLDALGDGDVPLEFLFSGTVFYATDAGLLQTVRIPWDARGRRSGCRSSLWRETMDAHFPDSAWLRLDKDALRPAGRLPLAQGAADLGGGDRRAACPRRRR